MTRDEADEGEGLRGLGEPRHDPGVREDRTAPGGVRGDLPRGDAGNRRAHRVMRAPDQDCLKNDRRQGLRNPEERDVP